MTAIDPTRAPASTAAARPAPRAEGGASAPGKAIAPDALALSRPAGAAPAAPPAKAKGLFDRLKGVLGSVADFGRHLFVKDGLWHNPEAPKPPAKPTGLDVMSYNVMVKTKNLDAVARDLEAARPDVVNLQETSERTAKILAKRLGMHMAWQEDPLHGYGGVAILSRYPISAYESRKLEAPIKERLAVVWNGLKTRNAMKISALDTRYAIHARLKVGDREVDMLNGHLQLMGAEINAGHVREVTQWATELERQGRTVVLAGDWNTNMATFDRPGSVADAKGEIETPTDTYAEARERRPGTGLSNSGNPENREALVGLFERFGYYWDAPERTVKSNGALMTPEEAQRALAAGKLAPDSAEAKRLRAVMDGATLPSGYLRFDNLFASKDVRFESAHIDQTTRASDHQPISARLRWD